MGCNCGDKKKKDSSVKQPLWRKMASQRNKKKSDES